ncbi:MAG: BON domain-containing protein, partial [Chloroflexi bacterium]|nr:BON domain-containing protein [Chloroflexota bacterium]
MHQQRATETDLELERRVRAELGPLELTGLQLRVQRGVVHLVGTVPTQDARDEAVERAERVPG